MNIDISVLFAILATHFVADFVLQSSWMAMGKSKKFLPLAAHVGVYTLMFGIMSQLWLWALINGVLHFATDFVTSRITSKLYAASKFREFFSVIGLDQLIHYVCLIGTFVYLYN